jgi:hypothetical protein
MEIAAAASFLASVWACRAWVFSRVASLLS